MRSCYCRFDNALPLFVQAFSWLFIFFLSHLRSATCCMCISADLQACLTPRCPPPHYWLLMLM
jgi:hypothetical protein